MILHCSRCRKEFDSGEVESAYCSSCHRRLLIEFTVKGTLPIGEESCSEAWENRQRIHGDSRQTRIAAGKCGRRIIRSSKELQ